MRHVFRYPYLRNVFLACAAAILILIGYNVAIVYPSFDRMLTENTEEDAVRVASYLTGRLIGDPGHVRMDTVDIAGMLEAVRRFKLWKLKLFARDGEVVFSTEPTDIGKVNKEPYFHQRVAKGEILSAAKAKNQRSSEGEIVPVTIVETYVPILDGSEFGGAFEIYYDITKRKAVLGRNLWMSSAVSIAIALLFLGAMAAILARAGRAESERQRAEEDLRRYQHRLVESEKMAALGGLVAGVAHEINTPVGAAVTAASTLEARTQACVELFETNGLKRTDLQRYFEVAVGTAGILLASLRQAADLIGSFKQLAVDRTSEYRRVFRVRRCLEDALLSLRPRFRGSAHEVRIDCPEALEMDSYPGALSRVFSNLVVNSLFHGFDGVDKGTIRVDVAAEDGAVTVRYADDGRGMAEETLRRVFEPFFTTKRGQGGSGLGMHIVYNLVTQTLGGRIECASEPGRGAVFTVRVPTVAGGEA